MQQLLNWFQGYLDGLAALRRYELAGDWSKYDEAGVAAMRASVAERIATQEQIVQDIGGESPAGARGALAGRASSPATRCT